MSDKYTTDFVLCNFRYLVGGNELAARISQRQQTLTLAIAVYSGLVLALLASKDLLHSGVYGINLLLLGFVFAGIAVTLLNYKYETGLAVSRKYLADLEQMGASHEILPSYNAGTYASSAHGARGAHGIVSALLILVYTTIAAGVFASESSLPNFAVIIITGALITIALALAAVNVSLNIKPAV